MNWKGWSGMMVFFLLPALAWSAENQVKQKEWVYLQSGSHLRVSIETNKAHVGMVPVVISVAQKDICGRMDGAGRVFAVERGFPSGFGELLFVVDLKAAQAKIGDVFYPIQVYENDPARIRFWFADEAIELPLRLDKERKTGVLLLGGLEIPAQVVEAEAGRIKVADIEAGGENKFGIAPEFMATAQLIKSRIQPRAK